MAVARRHRRRDQSPRRDGHRARTSAASAASTSSRAARTRCAASAWITSTCIRSTAGTPRRPSRKRSTRSIRWCAPGKVRYLGASSMAAWQLSKALYTAKENGWHRFVSMQNHYNLVYREEEREMIPLCIDQGLGDHSVESAGARLSHRQPEAADGGATTRVRRSTRSRRTCTTGRRFRRRRRGCRGSQDTRRSTPAQVACAWVLQAPGVTAPIIGATKTAQLKDVIAAVDLKLTAEEIAALEKPYRPHRILGHAQPSPKSMAN